MVLRSVDISPASTSERCDLCGGVAVVKVTNRAFFILVACQGCWNDLRRQVDDYVGRAQSASASSPAPD